MDADRGVENEPSEFPCPVCRKPVRFTLGELMSGCPLTCAEGHEFSKNDCAGLPEIIRFLADLDTAVERYEATHPVDERGTEEHEQ